MKTLNLEPGTEAWLKARAKYFTASEASAMKGAHPSVSRNDLLKAKHAGFEKEVSRFVREKIFDRGHEVEALARPIAEEIIGEELYPATVCDDDERLSASLDGMTLPGTVIWECKQWNADKAELVESGKCPDCDIWQVIQQLKVTGAEKCLYMVTDGTEENTRTCWVYPDPDEFAMLDAGWKQFQSDMEVYEPREDEPEAVGAKMANLPALHIEVKGEVVGTNLEQYKDHALSVFQNINEDLQTDQDFATAEETVKWCKTVEDKLELAKEQALSQTASIDELFRTVDEIKETARQKRLSLDKLVKQRKEARRSEIQDQAVQGLSSHYKQINETLPNEIRMNPPSDFRREVANAMKGKRTITSLIDSADQALADAKLAASAEADTIRANLRQYDELAGDYKHLFADLRTLVGKPADDFANTVKLRISEHKEAEQAKAANDQASAAMQQQADAAHAERPGTQDQAPAKATETRKWTLEAVFEIDAPMGTTAGELAGKLQGQLERAGFKSVTNVRAEQVRDAA